MWQSGIILSKHRPVKAASNGYHLMGVWWEKDLEINVYRLKTFKYRLMSVRISGTAMSFPKICLSRKSTNISEQETTVVCVRLMIATPQIA